MTLAMPDSIDPAALPAGYAQYLGYVDGAWPTTSDLIDQFPGARIIGLTVSGGTLNADGIDCEPGNPNAAGSAAWTADKLATVNSGVRPVIYASVVGSPGYGMPDVLSALSAKGIARGRVRLLAAHYTGSEHICGPATCGASPVAMDGTQWTDTFRGVNGKLVDMSALRDDFFGPAPPPLTWTEKIVQQLPTVKQGDTGEGVRTLQGALWARHHGVTIDGIFGNVTLTAVLAVQAGAHITQDGIVGQQTWPVLLGVA